MAGSGVSLYATTAAGNKTVIGTIDWREDTYMPSQINDNVGQIMADIRALVNAIGTGYVEIGDGEGTYTATYVSATSFRFDGVDVSAYYRAGMRVRVVAPTPGTISGTITSSVFSTHTTLVVAWDSGSLSNEAITSVSLGIGSGGGSGAQPSYRNILGRNAGMEVWQRGAGGSASFNLLASTSRYTADGWWLVTGANQATNAYEQAVGLANGSRRSMSIQRAPGQTGTGAMMLEFPLDAEEIAVARGQIVTLSCVMQAGPAFSPAGGTMGMYLYTGTGAAARRATGAYTGEVIAISGVGALTTAAARYSFTSAAVIGATVTQASVVFSWAPAGTADGGGGDYFALDDVQLEVGSSATPFERRPFEQELMVCRRHYWKTFPYATAPAQNAGTAGVITVPQYVGASAVNVGALTAFPVPMRSVPSVTFFNPSAVNAQARNLTTGTDCTVTQVTVANDHSCNVLFATPPGSAISNNNAVHMAMDAGI